MRSRHFWRNIRITVLSLVLVIVAGGTWLDQHRTTSWQHPVWVGAFPINADGSDVAAQYIAALGSAAELQPVTDFVALEAHRYGIRLDDPVDIRLYPPPAERPPVLSPRASVPERIVWSLRLRLYRLRILSGIERGRPQIVLFLLYHDPARSATLPHSVGLQRGLLGVVHLFATPAQAAQNAVVTAHELLHTFGATDKYDLETGIPRYPEGYAEPGLDPRYPQHFAEIMAGRIPLTSDRQVMPDDLAHTVVGPATAREIGWIHR